jgi:hypothetical protein
MKYTLVLLTTLFTVCVQAKQIKVAVLDTGMDAFRGRDITLCETGHKDFTGEGIKDLNEQKHGTHIAGIIDSIAKENYCIMVLKVFSESTNNKPVISTTKAIYWAISQGVDIINYSAGGFEYSYYEGLAVRKALDAGIVFVSATGNNNTNLDDKPFYPAAYDSRIVVIGNGHKDKRFMNTNYGKIVDFYVPGVKIRVLGIELSGSSQSTAIATGHIVNKLSKERKYVAGN